MGINISDTEYISHAYEAGYKKCLEDTGSLPKFLSQKMAYKKYKRKQVEYWVRAKLITPIESSNKKNGALKYSRERLEMLDNLSRLDLLYGKIPPEKILKDE